MVELVGAQTPNETSSGSWMGEGSRIVLALLEPASSGHDDGCLYAVITITDVVGGKCGRTSSSSDVLPEYVMKRTVSVYVRPRISTTFISSKGEQIPEGKKKAVGLTGLTMPRSPCSASVGCRNEQYIPKLFIVATTFSPILPLFPTPHTISLDPALIVLAICSTARSMLFRAISLVL